MDQYVSLRLRITRSLGRHSLKRMGPVPTGVCENWSWPIFSNATFHWIHDHDALFANQPEEGKRGYDKTQLIELGKNVGITDPAFAQTVNAGTYDQQINTAFQQIENDPKLAQDFGGGQRGFGTPTVTANGSIVSWQDPSWLTKVTG